MCVYTYIHMPGVRDMAVNMTDTVPTVHAFAKLTFW